MEVKINFGSITSVRALVRKLYLTIQEKDILISEQKEKLKKYERHYGNPFGATPNKLTVLDTDDGISTRVEPKSTKWN